jgi:hypothetical protein
MLFPLNILVELENSQVKKQQITKFNYPEILTLCRTIYLKTPS